MTSSESDTMMTPQSPQDAQESRLPEPPQNLNTSFEDIVLANATANRMKHDPKFTASRSVLRIDPKHLPDNLTATTLAGQGMISQPPYVFTDDTNGVLLAFYQVGRRLAGHAGFIHGGVLGVLLDECMGRACFPRLEGKIAVTAKLEISYKAPLKIDSVISIRAETTDIKGRKAFVDAVVEDGTTHQIVATAWALFIEPKWASEMSPCLPSLES